MVKGEKCKGEKGEKVKATGMKQNKKVESEV